MDDGDDDFDFDDIDLSQKLPDRRAKANQNEFNVNLRKMLGELDDSDKEKTESKVMTSILKQSTQLKPENMIPISETDELERKSIENSLQSRGLRRSVAQVKQAQVLGKVLKLMRAPTGEGSRFVWNNQKWQRTIKCLEDDTFIPKATDMEAWEQISLCEQVDFNCLKMHNLPRSVTHSSAERKAINKAHSDFKAGIYGYKNFFQPWESWCITQLTARISVLNGMQRLIFVLMWEAAKKKPETPLKALDKWFEAWHRATNLMSEESNALANIITKQIPPEQVVPLINRRWVYLTLNSPENGEDGLYLNPQKKVWRETSGRPEQVAKNFRTMKNDKKDSSDPYSYKALEKLNLETRKAIYQRLTRLYKAKGRKNRRKTQGGPKRKKRRKKRSVSSERTIKPPRVKQE